MTLPGTVIHCQQSHGPRLIARFLTNLPLDGFGGRVTGIRPTSWHRPESIHMFLDQQDLTLA